jgi:transcriptional regulator with XRE-family HTH domain
MHSSASNIVLMHEIGERITRHRLNRNLTQEDLAKQAGIGLATLKRIEYGSTSIQLINLVSVLRVLGMERNLDLLVPEVPSSPVQIANTQKKNVRRRARSKTNSAQISESPTWTWSDDNDS